MLSQLLVYGEGGRRDASDPAMSERDTRERDPNSSEEEEEEAVGGRRRASVLSQLDLRPVVLPSWAVAEGLPPPKEPKTEVKVEVGEEDEEKEDPICSIVSVEGGAVDTFYGTAKDPTADEEMKSNTSTSSSPRTWGSAHEYLRIEMLPEEVAETCKV